jgi:hypothetical protein
VAGQVDPQKLQKLFALATQTSNEHEARTAAVLFCKLLDSTDSFDQLMKVFSTGTNKKSVLYEQVIDQKRARASYDYRARTMSR